MQIPGHGRQPQIGRKNDLGLDDLLEHYGFKIKDDLMLEPQQNVPGPVPVQGQMFLANYPTFIAATNFENNRSSITQGLRRVLPFASSVELVKGQAAGPDLHPARLVHRATRGGSRGFFLFDPETTSSRSARTTARSPSARRPRAS